MPTLSSGFKMDRFPIYTAGAEAVNDYRRAGVKRNAPKIKVVVNSPLIPYVPVEIVSTDMSGMIVGTTMEKSRSEAGGRFSVTFIDNPAALERSPLGFLFKIIGYRIKELFKPMSLSYLYYDGYLVMQGYVSSARRVTAANGDKTVVVQFKELGTLYDNEVASQTDILLGAGKNILNNPHSFLTRVARLQGLKPETALAILCDSFVRSTLAYGTKGTPPFFRSTDGLPMAFRLIASIAPLGCISTKTLLSNLFYTGTFYGERESVGSFFGFLKSTFGTGPWVEMWTETGGRTMVVGRRNTITGVGLEQAINDVANLRTSAVASLSGGIGSDASFNKAKQSNFISILLPFFNYFVFRATPYGAPMIGSFNKTYANLESQTMGVFDLISGGDFVIISEDDIIQKDIGVSEANQKTSFTVDFDGGKGSYFRPSIANGPYVPHLPGGIKTYGVRTFNATLKSFYAKLSPSAKTTAGIAAAKKQHDYWTSAASQLLNYWFRNQAKFNEGTIVTRLIPYARPGMMLMFLPPFGNRGRVDETSEIGIYYIDNVTHSRVVGGAETTQFSVIRGMPLPLSASEVTRLFLDWEIFPPGPNLNEATA